MVILDFGAKFGPRVWVGAEEVTNRCHQLDILPGRQAVLHLFVVPHVLDTQYVDSGFGMGVPESELRKQFIKDEYMVIACQDCGDGNGLAN